MRSSFINLLHTFNMFESDDFDQVLSQFEIPDVTAKVQPKHHDERHLEESIDKQHVTNKVGSENTRDENVLPLANKISNGNISTSPNRINNANVLVSTCSHSPKHTKRKMLNSYFNHNSKRKFPGPAGLLTGSLEETKNESICQMELLSQDVDFAQNPSRRELFDSPIWMKLLEDIKNWTLFDIDPIKEIKQQALAGNLRKRKAQTVVAFVETIDRSAVDPLVVLRDTTGNIKCTLHRDAWCTFSPYIVSEYCALVLRKPTVLTTGSTFKKHYLNITLSNIYALYSSAVLEDDKPLLDGYTIVLEEDITVIKSNLPQNCDTILRSNESAAEVNDLEDLDSIFTDDIF